MLPAKKNTRGPSRMLKQQEIIRQTNSKIKIAYDPRHCGAPTSKQHSAIATSCGTIIRDHCHFQWDSWALIPDEKKELVRDALSVSILTFTLYHFFLILFTNIIKFLTIILLFFIFVGLL